jgi:hypothetical protein
MIDTEEQEKQRVHWANQPVSNGTLILFVFLYFIAQILARLMALGGKILLFKLGWIP